MSKFTDGVKSSFTLYDIFGYLLPGFFLVSLLVLDYDAAKIIREYSRNGSITYEAISELHLKTELLLRFFSSGSLNDFKFIPFLLFLIFCYLIGHVVAAFSSYLLERVIVKQFWGYPSFLLLRIKKTKEHWPYQNFKRPFDEAIIKKIDSAVAEIFGESVERANYYWICYSYLVTARPYLTPRAHHFVNLYGFSRNVAGTFLLYVIFRIAILRGIIGSPINYENWIMIGIYIFVCLLMFGSYLKLFRRQAIDIYYLFLSVVANTKIEGNNNPVVGEDLDLIHSN